VFRYHPAFCHGGSRFQCQAWLVMIYIVLRRGLKIAKQPLLLFLRFGPVVTAVAEKRGPKQTRRMNKESRGETTLLSHAKSAETENGYQAGRVSEKMKIKKFLIVTLVGICVIVFVADFVPKKYVYSQNAESKAVKETRYWGPIAYNSSIVFRPATSLSSDGSIWEQGVAQAFGPFAAGSVFLIAFKDRVYKVRLVETPESPESELKVDYSDGIHGWMRADSSNRIISIEGIQVPWSWHQRHSVFVYSDRYWQKNSSDCYSLRFADVSPLAYISLEEKNKKLFYLLP